LGFFEPEFEDDFNVHYDFLNDYQNEIIAKALSAKDYFLIQGPPGTGKTARIIRALAKYHFENSEKKIMLCAYTNRAVDEICSALDNVCDNFPFIRISGKELENYYERSLPNLSNKFTLSGLKKEIQKTRFFVSTISSLHTTPEIFDLVDFDLLILDEASQVLETQIIGILSQFEQCILIGDEKQLPAIVTQDFTSDPILLEKLGLVSFSESYFQRILRICVSNGWTKAFATLTHQGRMHEQIQQLSNYLVYDEKLVSFKADRQLKKDSQYFLNSDKFLKNILSGRITFINSPKTNENKYHTGESAYISKMVNMIFASDVENFSEKTLGIISPFRLQCRTIINDLPQNIKQYVMVDTVERFQGSEKDIIIVSFATNFDYLLSSIQNEISINGNTIDRKLNVAATRAKEHLIFLGNEAILSQSVIYKKAIDWIKKNGLFIDGSK
jgi:DNA replication ATP-dependent helicase Dna2